MPSYKKNVLDKLWQLFFIVDEEEITFINLTLEFCKINWSEVLYKYFLFHGEAFHSQNRDMDDW